MRSSLIHIVFALLFLGGLSPSRVKADDSQAKGAWHIVADSLTYDKESTIYTAEGHVTVTYDDETIQADFLEYDRTLNSTFARGNVVVRSRNGDQGIAQRALFDVGSGQGTLYDGTIFIETSHLYIRGSEIKKTGELTYTADKVTLTSCDGDNPDWSFSGRDLTVTIEGYGTVFHAAFWVKKLPLLYSPFLVFPVKIKRQTGLLAPQFAQSTRKGTEYLQPFFWAISDSQDATLYTRSMSKRGTMKGGEYRYMLDSESKGTVMADYLDDKRIDDGTEENTLNWGYDDSVERLNNNRYWIRSKHNQQFPDGSTLKLDTDIVSDQDYLREFSTMKNGYNESTGYFTGNYGRDLELNDNHIRTNSLIFNKTWASYTFNASAYWYDNIVLRQSGETDTTLQKLPTMDFTASRHQILNSPFYYDLDSEYTYFFRKDVTEPLRKGNRADLYPRLILPLRCKNLFSLETAWGYRHTYWDVENETEMADDLNGSHYRKFDDLQVDLSTNIYRIFNTGLDKTDKIKHTFTPTLTYNYTPEMDQNELPYFDAVDRIERKNNFTLTLDNTFTSRTRILPLSSKDSPAQTKYSYRQFCRFKLEQVYDMNEARETDPVKLWNQETLEKEPFRPLSGEIEIFPINYLSFEGDAKWSYYDQQLTEGNLVFKAWDKRGDSFRIEQRYTHGTLKNLISNVNLVLTDSVSLYFYNERDLIEREDIKTSGGLNYMSQCWGVQLDYTHEDYDKRYTVTVTLKGLGEFGTSYSNDRQDPSTSEEDQSTP